MSIVKFKKLHLAASIALALTAAAAQAAPVTGTIGFAGPGSFVGASNWYQSTGVDFTGPWATTVGGTGTFAAIPMFTNPVTFADFNWGASSGAVNIPTPIAPVWTFTYSGVTYELDIGSITNILRGSAANNSISVSGTGTLKATGYENTVGTWNFTGGATGESLNLSFSSQAVPLPATIGLLGLGLAALGVASRRRVAA